MAHDRTYDPRFPDEEWNKALLLPDSTVDDEDDDGDEDEAPPPRPSAPMGLRTVNTPTRAPQRKVK